VWGRGAGLAALALLCTACVKGDVDLTVRADDHVDGTIVVAVDRSFLPADPAAASALVDQVRSRAYAGTPSGATREPYADARYVGSRVTIRDMSLLDFDRGTTGGGLKIVHEGGRFKLTGTVDTAGLAPAPGTLPTADQRRAAASFAVAVRVTFPGRVVSTNGSADGDTVTWRPRLGERLELTAEAEDGTGPGWTTLVVAILVLVAAAALALAVHPRPRAMLRRLRPR